MDEAGFRALLDRAMDGIASWERGFEAFEPDPSLDVPPEVANSVIDELIERLHDNRWQSTLSVSLEWE